MKRLLLALCACAMVFASTAQTVPMKVYNGTSVTLIVSGVAVSTISPACATGGTTSSVNTAIAPGGIITINPILPGNSTVEWSAAKIHTVGGSAGIVAVHPYFTCFGTSNSWGFPTFTDYWYPLGSAPYQVLKIY